jgi:hypothetical protein
MEQEVAARGAAGQRQGGARIDDAGSRHAVSQEAKGVPTGGCVISAAWQDHRGGIAPIRRRTPTHETTAQSRSARYVWGNVGRIFSSWTPTHETTAQSRSARYV